MSSISCGDYGLTYCLIWETLACLDVLRKGMTLKEATTAALAGDGCEMVLDELKFCEN